MDHAQFQGSGTLLLCLDPLRGVDDYGVRPGMIARTLLRKSEDP